MNAPADGFRVDVMAEADVALAVDWAAAEGWNPGLSDAACFRAADPGGFLVGRLDGVPVATISVVRYGTSFAFLGLYIVAPAQRGKGYGLRLWRAGLARAAGRTVGLDGVLAQQANYRKSGFALAYRNIRYQGRGGSTAPPDPRVEPLSARPVDEVIAYDRPFFPDDRTAFLRAWLAQPQARALRRRASVPQRVEGRTALRRRAGPRGGARRRTSGVRTRRRAALPRRARAQRRGARARRAARHDGRVRDGAHVRRPGAGPAAAPRHRIRASSRCPRARWTR